MDATIVARIRRKYKSLAPELSERGRRQWAASEANELGYGGISLVSRATGLSRPTITVGRRELKLPKREREKEAQRIRRTGGGRHRLVDMDPDLVLALSVITINAGVPITISDGNCPVESLSMAA